MIPPVLFELKFTETLAPLHATWLVGRITCPDGFTIMVKVFAGPAQLTVPFVNVGVTVIVAVTGTVPLLIALKFEISPVPLAASPIDVVLFIQE